MKTNNEIIKGIVSTFNGAGCELSEVQEIVLNGTLHVWLEQVRVDSKLQFIEELKKFASNYK